MSKKPNKASGSSAATSEAPPRLPSKLKPGKRSARIETRTILVYGPPGSRKTTACASLPLNRTKWLISDSNCLATLTALGRTPSDDDTYEVSNLQQAIDFTEECLTIAEENPDDLGFSYLCLDSLTQFADWHQADVAKETGQRWLGDDVKNNGWQQFNVQFGKLLDNLAALGRYVTVVNIAHSKEKPPAASKGEMAGIGLTPQMALKAGRLHNWILLKTLTVYGDDGNRSEDDCTVKRTVRGITEFVESTLETQPIGTMIARANLSEANRERSTWPGDLMVLLKAEGLA